MTEPREAIAVGYGAEWNGSNGPSTFTVFSTVGSDELFALDPDFALWCPLTCFEYFPSRSEALLALTGI